MVGELSSLYLKERAKAPLFFLHNYMVTIDKATSFRVKTLGVVIISLSTEVNSLTLLMELITELMKQKVMNN